MSRTEDLNPQLNKLKKEIDKLPSKPKPKLNQMTPEEVIKLIEKMPKTELIDRILNAHHKFEKRIADLGRRGRLMKYQIESIRKSKAQEQALVKYKGIWCYTIENSVPPPIVKIIGLAETHFQIRLSTLPTKEAREENLGTTILTKLQIYKTTLHGEKNNDIQA